MSDRPQPRQPAALPARDETAALAAAGGDADLAQELFAALLEELPRKLGDLRAAVAERDWPSLADHAHQLRGASRYCGVPALEEALEALERTARLPDAGRAPSDFAQVELEGARLLSEPG